MTARASVDQSFLASSSMLVIVETRANAWEAMMLFRTVMALKSMILLLTQLRTHRNSLRWKVQRPSIGSKRTTINLKERKKSLISTLWIKIWAMIMPSHCMKTKCWLKRKSKRVWCQHPNKPHQIRFINERQNRKAKYKAKLFQVSLVIPRKLLFSSAT